MNPATMQVLVDMHVVMNDPEGSKASDKAQVSRNPAADLMALASM